MNRALLYIHGVSVSTLFTCIVQSTKMHMILPTTNEVVGVDEMMSSPSSPLVISRLNTRPSKDGKVQVVLCRVALLLMELMRSHRMVE
jgi:hypothetical protein